MQAEEAWGDTQLAHTLELIVTRHLGVDDDVARILARMSSLGRFEGIEDVIDGCVSVAVDGHLKPAGVVAHYL